MVGAMLTASNRNTRQWYWQAANSEVVQQPEAELEKAQVAAIRSVNPFIQTGLQCQDTKKKRPINKPGNWRTSVGLTAADMIDGFCRC